MTEPTQSGISRRTLAKGAAWSVPAVAVAAAAPAYAVSGPITFSRGASCKNTSGRGANKYYFVFITSLPVGTSVTVTSWTWTPNATDHDFVAFTPVTTTVTSTGQLVYAFTDDASSGTNGELNMCFSWTGGSVCVSSGNNNYSSCANTIPATSAGTGATFDPTKVWPVPALRTQGQASSERASAEQPQATMETPENDVKVDEAPAAVKTPAPTATTPEAPAADA